VSASTAIRIPQASHGWQALPDLSSSQRNATPESPVRELRLALTVEDYDQALAFYRDVLDDEGVVGGDDTT
jgi:hypothetical protein